MAISITAATRNHGPTCEHLTVDVDHEGVPRSFQTSFSEIDSVIDRLGGPQDALRVMVMLWAAYRRAKARTIVGVEIA